MVEDSDQNFIWIGIYAGRSKIVKQESFVSVIGNL